MGARGAWVPTADGVYRLAGVPHSWRGELQAALLDAGDASLITHGSAAKLERFPGPYAVAASQARYVFERGDWKAAAELPVRTTKFLYADAITYFARAVGAARSGDPDAALTNISKLIELRDSLKEAKDAYWSNIVDIQQQVATAWVLHAQGKYAGCRAG